MTIEEVPELDLSVVTLPPSTARPAGTASAPCGPIASIPSPCTRAIDGFTVLLRQGGLVRAALPLRVVGAVREPPLRPRVDLTAVADELSALEPGGGRWMFDGVAALTPALHRVDGAASDLDPADDPPAGSSGRCARLPPGLGPLRGGAVPAEPPPGRGRRWAARPAPGPRRTAPGSRSASSAVSALIALRDTRPFSGSGGGHERLADHDGHLAPGDHLRALAHGRLGAAQPHRDDRRPGAAGQEGGTVEEVLHLGPGLAGALGEQHQRLAPLEHLLAGPQRLTVGRAPLAPGSRPRR